MGQSSATIISACGLWMLWFRIYMLLLLLMVLVCALMLTLLRLFIPSWKWFPSRLNCVINSWPRNLFSLIVWDWFVYEGVIATTVNTIPSDELDIVFNYNRIKLLYIYMDFYLYQCAIKYKGYMINNSMLLFRTLSDRREKCSKNSTKTYFFKFFHYFIGDEDCLPLLQYFYCQDTPLYQYLTVFMPMCLSCQDEYIFMQALEFLQKFLPLLSSLPTKDAFLEEIFSILVQRILLKPTVIKGREVCFLFCSCWQL